MPTTDHKRDERLQVLHKCLKNNMGKWSVKKLHEKVNDHLAGIGGNPVSERTIAADLEYLELQKGAPVEMIKQGRNVYYTYSEDFDFNEPVVTKDEYLSLLIANEVLSQLKGFTLTKELKDLTAKLQLYIEDTVQERPSPIIFDSAPALKLIERLQDILECILEKTVLQISYQPFGAAGPVEKIVHPYCLKQYNQRWFLFGYDEANNRIDNSPIDRIARFTPLNKAFIENNFFNQDEYFKDMIGVTRKAGQQPEHIVFRVSVARADYLMTKPLHHSQTVSSENEGGVVFTMSVVINKELISVLLSFGSDIEIIEPVSLRSVMRAGYEAALSKYE
ncbi:WYL domain-containing protein [Agriterribacter sp.]|uniref:helix-turn-helix transcriptional regulator n=1 Tax=Agriterribacter sp. TaxID=2821509 RepID=UPI002C338D79|nr:WYL domain-containing protein [Agriterribacter sp.]HRP57154.1 WYL domain-containing protein [Agriterribacter sp.]